MHHHDDIRTLIDEKILLTGPVRPRSVSDRDRIRAALRARRLNRAE